MAGRMVEHMVGQVVGQMVEHMVGQMVEHMVELPVTLAPLNGTIFIWC